MNENAIVIAFDYSLMSSNPDFGRVYEDSFPVAERIATIMDWIIQEKSLNSSLIHFMGFSLGGHMPGK